MLEAIFLIAATGALLMMAIRWQTSLGPTGDSELCWSCGQRGQHKLWCPNR
jgi:hypothetical protein